MYIHTALTSIPVIIVLVGNVVIHVCIYIGLFCTGWSSRQLQYDTQTFQKRSGESDGYVTIQSVCDDSTYSVHLFL